MGAVATSIVVFLCHWVDRTLPNLGENDAQARIRELTNEGINPSEYLRDDGRHAIAHAEKDVFVNPDKLVDHERIFRDLPVSIRPRQNIAK